MEHCSAVSSDGGNVSGSVCVKPQTKTLFWFHNDGEKLYMIPDYWKDMYDFLKFERGYELYSGSSARFPKGKLRVKFPEMRVYQKMSKMHDGKRGFMVSVEESGKVVERFYVNPRRSIRLVVVGKKFFAR